MQSASLTKEITAFSRKDKLAIGAAMLLLPSLALALWTVYGPGVFTEMAAGFMAFCF